MFFLSHYVFMMINNNLFKEKGNEVTVPDDFHSTKCPDQFPHLRRRAWKRGSSTPHRDAMRVRMKVNFINIGGRPFLTKRNYIKHAEMKTVHVTPHFIAGPGRDNDILSFGETAGFDFADKGHCRVSLAQTEFMCYLENIRFYTCMFY